MKIVMVFLCMTTWGCAYPGIGLNKGKLLDPTMDPAKTELLSNRLSTWSRSQAERANLGSGGVSGSACPTCR